MALAVLFATLPAGAVTKVGCVGDSITYGYGLSSQDQSYPTRLGVLLGNGYEVKNYGESGAAVSKASDKPYWTQPSYSASTQYDADIVVIMLGTNDAKPSNWSLGTFTTDYAALVQHYLDLGAKVFLATPPPVFDPGAYSIDPHTLNEVVVPDVRQMAADRGTTPLIDVYAALDGQSSLFPDTVHPNADGAQLIANTVGAALLAATAGGNGGAAGAAGSSAAAGAPSGGGAGGVSSNAGAGGGSESGGRGPTGGQGAGAAPAGSGGAGGSSGVVGGAGGRSGGGAGAGQTAGAPGNGAGGHGGVAGASAGAAAGVGAVGGASAGTNQGTAGSAAKPSGAGSSSDDSGCGCRTVEHGANPPPWRWLALAALSVAALRRTRRRTL
jgi:MYXO-CTERM domain-containing protein